MDDELMELAAALLSVLLAALLIKDDDKLLAASALLATEELGALLAVEEIGVLLAATDDGVGEGAFVGSPLPPPQLERKPTTDKLNIAVLKRITNPIFLKIFQPKKYAFVE
jgi:hypothetical protein